VEFAASTMLHVHQLLGYRFCAWSAAIALDGANCEELERREAKRITPFLLYPMAQTDPSAH